MLTELLRPFGLNEALLQEPNYQTVSKVGIFIIKVGRNYMMLPNPDSFASPLVIHPFKRSLFLIKSCPPPPTF